MRGRLCGGPTHAALWIARRPMGADQGFLARPERTCRRQCSGQPVVRRSRSLQVSNGDPWRDLPARFGDWKIVHQRFSRWAKSGVFERIFKLLASDHDNEYMMIDATIVRAHQHSAG